MLFGLRFIGLMNAAVWLGAGVFFTLGVGPGVFSNEMKAIFPDRYVGMIAQILIRRYFTFHIICGCIALAHYFVESFYTRRPFKKRVIAMIALPLAIGLIGSFILQPRMNRLFQQKYGAAAQEQRDQAARQFGMIHGVAQSINLLALVLVAAFTWRIANPPETPRFVSAQKFRG